MHSEMLHSFVLAMTSVHPLSISTQVILQQPACLCEFMLHF